MAAKLRYTMEQVAAALVDTKGMVTLTARRLGCTPKIVYQYLERYPELKTIRDEQIEVMGDEVELALYDEAVEKRNIAALIFLAKTKFKARGYVERTEVTGADGGAIEVRAVDYRQVAASVAPARDE